MVTVTSALDRSKTNALKVNVESKSESGSATIVANWVTTERRVYRRNQRQIQRKQQRIRIQPVLIM